MVLVAGAMIDKLGITTSSMIFNTFCLLGNLLFTAAIYLGRYYSIPVIIVFAPTEICLRSC